MMRRTPPILAALACCLWLLPNASGQIRNEQHVKAELIANAAGVNPGHSLRVGVRLKIDPKWHVYWKYPGDAGMPTSVKWTLPEGFTVGELQYPLPHEFDEPGGIVVYGYEDEVMLSAIVTPPKNLVVKAGPVVNVVLKAEVSWLVCADVCIPGKADVELTLPCREILPSAVPEKSMVKFDAEREKNPLPNSSSDTVATAATLHQAAQRPLTVEIDWKQMPSDPKSIQWFPAVPDGLIPQHPVVKTDGTTTTATMEYETYFTAAPPKSMETVVAYTDAAGKRRGFILQVPLIPDQNAPTPPPAQR